MFCRWSKKLFWFFYEGDWKVRNGWKFKWVDGSYEILLFLFFKKEDFGVISYCWWDYGSSCGLREMIIFFENRL